MIICPDCKHENMDGTVFCSDCGAQLIGPDFMTTRNMEADIQGSTTVEQIEAPPAVEKFDSWASLHLMKSGQILPLPDRTEFTIGRISEAQPIMPDIDLTPYQAYANGVSRLHAVLKRSGEKVTIMDLGSSNGTFINGLRIKPNVDQTVEHGDTIFFGKLAIQILLKNS